MTLAHVGVLLDEVERWREHEKFDECEFAAWRSDLTPEERAVLDRQLAGESIDGWRAHPAALAYHLTRADWFLKRHVQFLSKKFVELVDGTSPRQIWNIGARYGKTRIGPRWGAAWNLDRTEGRARSINISYGKSLADATNVEVRNIIDGYDQIAAQTAPGRQRMDEWYTTTAGGMKSAGVGSAIIGFGVNEMGVLCVDDPFKNWQEAHNESARRKVHTEWSGTWRHRLDSEDAAILVVHHRFHRDDLTGHLEQAWMDDAGEEYEIIALPTIAREGDLLGREIGEVLDRETFDEDAVRTRHIALGSWVTAAVEQQDPPEAQGIELLREWFHLTEDLPPRYDKALTSWDLKLKDSEAGDFVAGQAWGRTGGDRWLIDGHRGQWDHATTMNAIALMQVRHPYIKRHIIEAAGSVDKVVPGLRTGEKDYVIDDDMAGRLGMTDDERAKVQELRRAGMTGLITRPPKGNKQTRARSYIAPPAEAGNLHVNARWGAVGPYLDEVAGFPDADYDDQVDASSQALKELMPGGGKPSRPPKAKRIAKKRKGASGRVARPRAPKYN